VSSAGLAGLEAVGESPRSPTDSTAGSGRANGVWIAPSANDFSCLCEHCLELARGEGGSFLDAVRVASVKGRLATDTDVGFIHCAAGHELIVRRVDRPLPLARPDGRQLQLT
jgi:hypothetical protein